MRLVHHSQTQLNIVVEDSYVGDTGKLVPIRERQSYVWDLYGNLVERISTPISCSPRLISLLLKDLLDLPPTNANIAAIKKWQADSIVQEL